MNENKKYWYVVFTLSGSNSGPGIGWASPSREVVTSRHGSLDGAKRALKKYGGRIEESNHLYSKGDAFFK